MAFYRKHHNILTRDSIAYDRYRSEEKYDSSGCGSLIRISSTSGTIDQYTEEIQYHQAHTWFACSGIVGVVQDNDAVLGVSGKARVGDIAIVYPYTLLSGFWEPHTITAVRLMSPVMSGLYTVTARHVNMRADIPYSVTIALTKDGS